MVVPDALAADAVHGPWTVHIQAGAGIVYASDPESEYQETVNKAAALGRAIDLAEQAFLGQAPAEAPETVEAVSTGSEGRSVSTCAHGAGTRSGRVGGRGVLGGAAGARASLLAVADGVRQGQPKPQRAGATRGMVRAVGGNSQARDPHVEHLHLAPYEAAYLVFDERLLIVSGLEGAPALWEFCRGRWPEFLRQYAVYRAYRRAGWALHSGCKYGADFVLYRFQRARARHVHTPYTVLVRRHDEPVQRRWIALQNQLRMTKQVAKRLVYVSVDDTAVRHCERERERWLAGVQLHEVLVDRWTAENKRGKNEEPG
eukprot:ctg_1206.g419